MSATSFISMPLFTSMSISYHRKHSWAEAACSKLSHWFYLGGDQATVINETSQVELKSRTISWQKVELQSGTMSWQEQAIKIALFIGLLPLTLLLYTLYIGLRYSYDFTVLPSEDFWPQEIEMNNLKDPIERSSSEALLQMEARSLKLHQISSQVPPLFCPFQIRVGATADNKGQPLLLSSEKAMNARIELIKTNLKAFSPFIDIIGDSQAIEQGQLFIEKLEEFAVVKRLSDTQFHIVAPLFCPFEIRVGSADQKGPAFLLSSEEVMNERIELIQTKLKSVKSFSPFIDIVGERPAIEQGQLFIAKLEEFATVERLSETHFHILSLKVDEAVS